MTIIIRDARPKDSQHIVNLLIEGLGYEAAALNHIEKRLTELNQHPFLHVLVAELNGEVVGVATFAVTTLFEYKKPSARISLIAVSSSARGCGIGRKLADEVELRARDAGCFRVELTSSHELTQAHGFWSELGYANSGLRFKRTLCEP